MARFNIKVAKGANANSDVERIRIGTHYDCLCQIDDPVAADFHARVSYEQGGFYVEDLGTSPGTFKNGLALKGKLELQEGDVLVIGRTHVTVGIKDAEVTLNAKPKSFFYEEFVKEKRDKKDAANILVASEEGDVVRWARSEVRFGRYAPMRAGNWLGLLGLFAAVVLGLLMSGTRESMSEPGDLHSSHARLFGSPERVAALHNDPNIRAEWILAAQEQGCAVCHDSFGGTPMEKCATCHADLMRDQHPFSDTPKSLSDVSAAVTGAGHLNRGWGGEDCLICHVDHQGTEPGVFVPTPAEAPETCSACHDVDALPAAAAITRALAEIAPSQVLASLPYDGFPHDVHEAIDCAGCHVYQSGDERRLFQLGDRIDDRNHREFAAIAYETCMQCHSSDAAQRDWEPASEQSQTNLFTLAWHGADDPHGKGAEANCTQCHSAVYDAPLRTVESVVLADFLPFAYERRTHQAVFEAHAQASSDDCSRCHVDGAIAAPVDELIGVFRHGVHMERLFPGGADGQDAATLSAECASCHAEFNEGAEFAAGLASGLYTGPELGQCSKCHTQGDFESDSGLRLEPRPPAEPPPAIERSDFPHAPHLTSAALAKPELERGCFACHDFDQNNDAYAVQPTTFAAAKNCVQCHDDHMNVGGGEPEVCSKCHSGTAVAPPSVDRWAGFEGWSGDPAFWGTNPSPPADVPAGKQWPPLNDFEHTSPGHDGVTCLRCHDFENISKVKTLFDVSIPDEADLSCRECHVEGASRFHWR